MPELPDSYETRQGAAMRAALDAGDAFEAVRIGNHLLAESATTPAEREQLAESMKAMVLYKAMLDATEKGDAATAQSARDRLLKECTPRSVKSTMAASYLQLGVREGLSPTMHQQLVEWVEELDFGPEIRAIVADIKLLPPDSDTAGP